LALKISLIGVGKMGSALARGWLRAGVQREELLLYDKNPLALEPFQVKAQIVSKCDVAINEGDIIVLAVKPKDLPPLLKEVGELLENKTAVSIAAGVPLKELRKTPAIWVRAMPNIACEVGQGLIAICGDERGLALAERIFQLVGRVLRVEEGLMDGITALSGSGPAFVLALMDSLADGGVKIGLPKELALQIVAQLFLGTASLLLSSNQHPMELKDSVCSPGGTTIAGLQAMERAGIRGILMEGVERAYLRAREMQAISEERER